MALLNRSCSVSKCIYRRFCCNSFQQIIGNPLLKRSETLCCHSRNFPLLKFSQGLSSNVSVEHSATPMENFQPIYKFPQIVLVRALCRLKLYQTTLVVGAIPVSFALQHLGFISSNSVVATFSVGILALVMLYVMSEFTRKAVGIIYIDQQGINLRIAHLDFWGKRRDIVVPVEDIVPLSDAEEDFQNVYVKLCRYSTKDVLYLCIKYGHVLDRKAFQKIFGSEET